MTAMLTFIKTLDPAWSALLTAELKKPYMAELVSFLEQEELAGKCILPSQGERFNALRATPLDEVKVVILGQDPYPTIGHAHGLSFSVLPEVKPLPRSLNNIYKELLDDIGVENHHTGYLQPWAEQGVLLLNSVLSVEAGKANSHQKKGWESLTDRLIQAVSAQKKPVVFILWGAYARKKASLVDTTVHYIIESAHPSPLSARRGFFGSRPFSRTNQYLQEAGRIPIQWAL